MSSRVRSRVWSMVVAVALLAVCGLVATAPASAQNAFGWEAGVYDENGEFDPTAGGHPHTAVTELWFKRATQSVPVANMRDLIVEVPDGLTVNPRAAERCTRADLVAQSCPPTSQIGTVWLEGLLVPRAKVYNLVPRPGIPAEFGFAPVDSIGLIYLQGAVTADGSVEVRLDDSNAGAPVYMTRLTLFGVPQDAAHGTGSTMPRRPFVTNPTSCVGPVDTVAHVNWWEDPAFETHVSTTPVGGVGCGDLEFEPTATVATTNSTAGAPTGLEFEIASEQPQNPDGRATAHIKDVEVQLPEGMTVNPSSGDGIAGCGPAQIDMASTDPVTCPSGSKIGDVDIVTPLLEEPVGGAVYLAQPYDNPSGGLLGLYLVAEDDARGIRIKLHGSVVADPQTGQLTTRFENNPQLPFSSLSVSIGGGPRSPLMNSRECGVGVARTDLSPWSAADPDHPTPSEMVSHQSTIVTDGCASGFAPQLAAGSSNPIARASSPFVLAVSRGDRDREISTLRDIELPTGLLGDISDVPLCDSVAADAGKCPAASRIGRVEAAAGAGAYPVWIPQAGKAPTSVSLAGPYRGAPYSLSVMVPAQAGPFDLGTVVVRSPLHVDIRTAQLSSEVAQSRVFDRHGDLTGVLEGRVPTILEGIPLRIRDIRVMVDRDGFMLNPSDCSAKQVGVTAVAVGGQTAATSNRFQAGACAALPFEPRLGLRLTGRRQVKIGRHPGVRALVRQAGVGEAGIRRARVVMPDSLALDPDNAQALCEYEDGTKPDLENHCPAGSKVGRARAKTPLLKDDLVGDVYFVKNVRRDPRTGNAIRTLPMLVVALRGDIDINLVGASDTARNGRLINTFNGVPDAPISRFNLNIRGGKNGILAVTRTGKGSENLCERPNRQIALARMAGHNNKPSNYRLRVKTPCTKKQVRNAKRAAKRAAKRSARRAART